MIYKDFSMANKRKRIIHPVDRLRTQICLHAVMNEFGGAKECLLASLNSDFGDSRALESWLSGSRVLNKRSVNRLEQVSPGVSSLYRHDLWTMWKKQLDKTGIRDEFDQLFPVTGSESHKICDIPYDSSKQDNIFLELLSEAKVSLSLLASGEKVHRGREFMMSVAYGHALDALLLGKYVLTEPVYKIWDRLFEQCFNAHDVLLSSLYQRPNASLSKIHS